MDQNDWGTCFWRKTPLIHGWLSHWKRPMDSRWDSRLAAAVLSRCHPFNNSRVRMVAIVYRVCICTMYIYHTLCTYMSWYALISITAYDMQSIEMCKTINAEYQWLSSKTWIWEDQRRVAGPKSSLGCWRPPTNGVQTQRMDPKRANHKLQNRYRDDSSQIYNIN